MIIGEHLRVLREDKKVFAGRCREANGIASLLHLSGRERSHRARRRENREVCPRP